MSTPWILTTPASRGIGFELARRLLKTTDLPVVATARRDIRGTRDRLLEGLNVDEERLEVLKLDVTDEDTVAAAASHCKSRFSDAPLRLAFCIPGVLHPEKSPRSISYDKALSTFQINTLGPLLLIKHFSPLLPKRSATIPSAANLPAAAVFALMSARVGSITDNQAGGWFSYRASKAAVNQLAKSLDVYLQQSAGTKALCVSLHPGTVKTELSKDFWTSTSEEKLFSPEYAAERLCEVVNGLGEEGRGKCWDWAGKEIPP